MSRFSQVGTADLRVGNMAMFAPDYSLYPGQEIIGKLVLTLNTKIFVRGIWIKFSGTIQSITFGRDDGGEPVAKKIRKHLMKSEEDYYNGGVHNVLIGFGEEESPDENGFLEMEEGTYTWPYYFKIPSDSPLSYCDNLSDVTYNLVAVVDTPVLVRAISQITHTIVVGAFDEASSRLLTCPRGILGIAEHHSRQKQPFQYLLCSRATVSMHLEVENPAEFPFKQLETLLPIKCRFENLKARKRVSIEVQLFAEVSLPSMMENHPPTTYRHVIWAAEAELMPQQSEVTIPVPIRINSNLRIKKLQEWPRPCPLPYSFRHHSGLSTATVDHLASTIQRSIDDASPREGSQNTYAGIILNPSFSSPLFSHTVAVEIAAFRGSKRRPLCPPCIAPIFIRPPSATIEIPTAEAESVSGLVIPASMSAQEARAAFGLARVMRPQQAADVRAEAVAIPAGGAERGSVDGAQPSRQQDNMTVASAAIDAISSGGQGTTAGGAGGAGGAGRGGGTGGAARQGIPPRGGSTPHAVLAIPKVTVEAISRGPAAVVLDRRGHQQPFSTPRQFAQICRVDEAVVVGTPQFSPAMAYLWNGPDPTPRGPRDDDMRHSGVDITPAVAVGAMEADSGAMTLTTPLIAGMPVALAARMADGGGSSSSSSISISNAHEQQRQQAMLDRGGNISRDRRVRPTDAYAEVAPFEALPDSPVPVPAAIGQRSRDHDHDHMGDGPARPVRRDLDNDLGQDGIAMDRPNIAAILRFEDDEPESAAAAVVATRQIGDTDFSVDTNNDVNTGSNRDDQQRVSRMTFRRVNLRNIDDGSEEEKDANEEAIARRHTQTPMAAAGNHDGDEIARADARVSVIEKTGASIICSDSRSSYSGRSGASSSGSGGSGSSGRNTRIGAYSGSVNVMPRFPHHRQVVGSGGSHASSRSGGGSSHGGGRSVASNTSNTSRGSRISGITDREDSEGEGDDDDEIRPLRFDYEGEDDSAVDPVESIANQQESDAVSGPCSLNMYRSTREAFQYSEAPIDRAEGSPDDDSISHCDQSQFGWSPSVHNRRLQNELNRSGGGGSGHNPPIRSDRRGSPGTATAEAVAFAVGPGGASSGAERSVDDLDHSFGHADIYGTRSPHRDGSMPGRVEPHAHGDGEYDGDGGGCEEESDGRLFVRRRSQAAAGGAAGELADYLTASPSPRTGANTRQSNRGPGGRQACRPGEESLQRMKLFLRMAAAGNVPRVVAAECGRLLQVFECVAHKEQVILAMQPFVVDPENLLKSGGPVEKHFPDAIDRRRVSIKINDQLMVLISPRPGDDAE